MERRDVRRVLAIALTGVLLVTGLVVGASAVSSVKVALHQKRDLQERIDQLHETRRIRRVALHKRIRFTKARLRNAAGAARVGDRERSWRYRERQLDRLAALRAEERRVIKSVRRRVRELQSERGELADWIDSLPFERCPVAGSAVLSDNFGVIREMPGTPRHIHQGVDIMAPTGTPIVAPFDGEAVAGSNYLGGQSVHVYGPAGYVYNAHLAAYGKLGPVDAGDVIGYVGVTGNATAPHDHFEWHPGHGAAVDPFSLLAMVC